MAGRTGTNPGDYPERGAKNEATQSYLQEDEDFENLDEDDFVDQDVPDEGEYESRLSIIRKQRRREQAVIQSPLSYSRTRIDEEIGRWERSVYTRTYLRKRDQRHGQILQM